jgi:hypothetical protein
VPSVVVPLLLAITAEAGAQAPAQDRVVVDASGGGDFAALVVDAVSGPSGEDPRGNVALTQSGVSVGGPVTCLAVSGSTATIVFDDPVFIPIKFTVADNGPPGSGLDTVRGVGFELDAADCSPIDDLPAVALPIGDIAVHDAHPGPVTKEQCKRGGFAQFGFPNQGQCVAAVQRGPKP